MEDRPRALGINHVALEVGDVDEALAFYGSIFEFTLRGPTSSLAFVVMVQKVLAHSPVAGSFQWRRPVSVILVGRRARTLELQWARAV